MNVTPPKKDSHVKGKIGCNKGSTRDLKGQNLSQESLCPIRRKRALSLGPGTTNDVLDSLPVGWGFFLRDKSPCLSPLPHSPPSRSLVPPLRKLRLGPISREEEVAGRIVGHAGVDWERRPGYPEHGH